MPITTSTVPAAEPGQDRLLLLGRPEAREHLDPHGIRREALAEGVPVLLGEDGGGHEHRHLVPVERDLERGAHRHLGLAVAHVAADEPVHRARRCSRSAFTWRMASSWSGVSSKGNAASNSCCQGVSRGDGRALRRPAARRRDGGAPAAISRRDARTDSLVRCQVVAPELVEPRRSPLGPPTYLVTRPSAGRAGRGGAFGVLEEQVVGRLPVDGQRHEPGVPRRCRARRGPRGRRAPDR